MIITPLILFILIVLGSLAGIIGALLGIGGGSILVPSLFLLFSFLGFPKDQLMQVVVGTSLASMLINTFGGLFFHSRKRSVEWSVVLKLIPGIAIGCLLGVLIARDLPSHAIRVLFGCLAIFIGFSFFKPLKEEKKPKKYPSSMLCSLIGAGVSTVSSLIGVGGGFFLVPIFFYYRFEGRKVMGTSSASTFFICLGATIAYLITPTEPLSVQGCYGYIFVPAFLILGLTSFLGSFYGVMLAHVLPVRTLRKIFAIVITAVGIMMIVN